MKKYEYRVVSQYLIRIGSEPGSVKLEKPESYLNKLGQQGWELVAVTHDEICNNDLYYLKREII
ncbi:MAG: DUF4177 domain-containing protein [Clostridia bacterium]|nr:DUF4177 domain-containing protein [Clostridia bacterium]